MEGTGRRGEWAWNSEKETGKKREGGSFQSASTRPTKVVVVGGVGGDKGWGMDLL